MFGLLATYESGALAMRAGESDVLALVYGMCSVGAFFVLAVKAVGHAHASGLGVVVLVSLAGVAGGLWTLYGNGHGERSAWVTTAMFGTAYSALCLLAGLVLMTVAWRRRHAQEVHAEHEHAQRDRRRRMEGLRAESSALAAQAGKDSLGTDSDFTLPSRPKWEDS